jgi:polyisoprenoid-binding protein YceI
MTWQLDPMHTQLEFAAKHFGMMTVRGRFNELKTSGSVDPSNPEGSTVEVVVDVASLNTHNAQRDNDLRSSYFLELDKYPTITFRSISIEPAGEDQYRMTGDLTIKGITKPVTLRVLRYGEINDPQMGHRVAYSAEGEINRKDFGMSFDMLADGKIIVSHEIKLMIETELVETQPAAATQAASAGTA